MEKLGPADVGFLSEWEALPARHLQRLQVGKVLLLAHPENTFSLTLHALPFPCSALLVAFDSLSLIFTGRTIVLFLSGVAAATGQIFLQSAPNWLRFSPAYTICNPTFSKLGPTGSLRQSALASLRQITHPLAKPVAEIGLFALIGCRLRKNFI